MPRSRKATIDLKVRMKEPLRAAIERAAKARGVSLNRETVARLEKSFQQDQAEETSLGGKKVAPLLRMLGAIAELVEQRTGGKVFDDWRTGIAVRAAWQRAAIQFFPRMPEKELRRFEEPWPERPVAPDLPTAPAPPPVMGLLFRDEEKKLAADEEYAREMQKFGEVQAKFKKAQAKYEKELTKYEEQWRLRDVKSQAYLEMVEGSEKLGRETAMGILNDEPKGK